MASAWLDFDAIRRQASFATILEYYKLKVIGVGARRFILCPFHQEATPSCSVELTRGLFHCFGCSVEGTIVDFVAKMERINLRSAAEKIVELCRVDTKSDPGERYKPGEHPADTSERTLKPITPLALDPEHPFLVSRGLTPETVERFGLGYCRHGLMRGRICIPIHDEIGNLVAYAARWASEKPPSGTPRYVLTPGFRKHRVLYNLHRVSFKERLVLVEGYWSAIRLHNLGLPVVALMGVSIFDTQINLLHRHRTRSTILLMDGDEPGYKAQRRLVLDLTGDFFVYAPRFPSEQKPDTVAEEELLNLVEF